MRVLMTTDTVGGVWTFAQELTWGLLTEGCSVALVAIGREPSLQQSTWVCDMREVWDGFEFASSPAPLEWMENNEGAVTEAEPLLLERIREFKPDVLHTNEFCFGALPVAIPKILTAHSDVLTWNDACRNAPLADSPWLRRYQTLVREGLQGAAALVTPSEWMLNALGEYFPLPGIRHVIPNGREVRPLRGEEKKLQAITAGRLWDEAKGVAVLRDVDSPMPLLVAGETKYGAADASGTSGSAKMLGRLSEDALLDLFEQSAIYICTSIYEPFGLAPLEAALCGCAVIARDLESLREVWGEHALYFDSADSLSKLLYALYDHGELLKQAQALSYARAKTYSRRATTASYLDLYRSLTGSVEEMADVA